MGSLATTLTGAQGPMFFYAEGLLKGVKAEQFARKPQGEHGVIDTNHPAFIYGHLSTYPGRVLDMIGVEGHGLSNPAGFDEVFAAGKECRDDPDGSIYPPMEAITAHFNRGYKALFAKLAELSDEHLAKPHGLDSDFGKNFGNRAALAAFMVGPHTFMHIGQMSAWRRCVGLPSAF